MKNSKVKRQIYNLQRNNIQNIKNISHKKYWRPKDKGKYQSRISHPPKLFKGQGKEKFSDKKKKTVQYSETFTERKQPRKKEENASISKHIGEPT